MRHRDQPVVKGPFSRKTQASCRHALVCGTAACRDRDGERRDAHRKIGSKPDEIRSLLNRRP